MPNWPKYISLTKNKAPRRLLIEALDFVSHKDSALDLGSGALNDTKYLLTIFNNVVAVDIEEAEKINNSAFIFNKTKIEDYDFPENTFDLISAQFILPFINKDELARVIEDIKKSLKSDGVFTGQFFGSKDSWSELEDVSVFRREDIEKMLSGFGVIVLREEEKDDLALGGALKHWHIFHFIVKLT